MHCLITKHTMPFKIIAVLVLKGPVTDKPYGFYGVLFRFVEF